MSLLSAPNDVFDFSLLSSTSESVEVNSISNSDSDDESVCNSYKSQKLTVGFVFFRFKIIS